MGWSCPRAGLGGGIEHTQRCSRSSHRSLFHRSRVVLAPAPWIPARLALNTCEALRAAAGLAELHLSQEQRMSGGGEDSWDVAKPTVSFTGQKDFINLTEGTRREPPRPFSELKCQPGTWAVQHHFQQSAKPDACRFRWVYQDTLIPGTTAKKKKKGKRSGKKLPEQT